MVAPELERGKEMEPSKNEDELTLRREPLDGEIVEDELDIPDEAYTVLHKLAENWTDIAGYQNLSLKRLKGAMTNEVFECHWAVANKRETPRKVLLRVYGESADLFFNRHDEILTFEKMSQHGQGPRLLARFDTGRVEEFLNARTLSAVDLRNNKITDQIARKLREFHGLDMPGPAKPIIWHRLSLWLEKALELASPSLIREFRLDQLDEEITKLEKMLRRPGENIGFCHNDLQYGNIMMDEDNFNVTIIDYEYASFNPVAFDIANYFCEMAADYHTDTPHLLDYSKYPVIVTFKTHMILPPEEITGMSSSQAGNPELHVIIRNHENRRRFASTYLQATAEEAEIESLVKDAESYRLPSHLQWGLWGIISAVTSDIDFDYLSYARQRFQQYYLVKSQFSEEDMPSEALPIRTP